MGSAAGQHSVKKSTVAYWVAQYRLMGICPMAEGPTEATPPPAPANAEQVSVPAVPPSPKPGSAAHKEAYKQAYKLAGEMYRRKSASLALCNSASNRSLV